MESKNEIIKDLNEQNDELENYFRNTIIPQLFVDAALILRKFTPPAMKQFDLHTEDIGKSIEDIHQNFRYPTIIDNIRQVIDSGDILEKEIQTTDMRWFQMNIIPYIKQTDNSTNGVIITFVDITSRIKDLKEQEKLIAEHEILLDTLSHDIKNPLGNLMLAIDQFKTTGTTDAQQTGPLIGIIERAVVKMHDLIRELTESRETEHKYKAKPELLNLGHIIEDVRLALNEDIQRAGATVKTAVSACEITFSRRKLRSIIYNLVSNSLKYRSSSRSPLINISAERQNDLTSITVTDNGMGIDADKQEAVFSKYYRVENGIEGSGIGLYLVRELVMRSGGTIEMKSSRDSGTTIRILLKDSQ